MAKKVGAKCQCGKEIPRQRVDFLKAEGRPKSDWQCVGCASAGEKKHFQKTGRRPIKAISAGGLVVEGGQLMSHTEAREISGDLAREYRSAVGG